MSLLDHFIRVLPLNKLISVFSLSKFIRFKHTRKGHKLFRAPWSGHGDFRAVPRKIWIYWADGRDQAPPLVKLCIRSWEVMNPGWDVIVLDETNFADYADLSDLDGAEVPIQTRSDILRCRLLISHGGVWADGTILCTSPLDNWLFAAMQSNAFMFSRPTVYRMVSNWFIAAQPGSRLLIAQNAAYTGYLTDPPIYKQSTPPPYFSFHYTVEYLYRTNSMFRSDLNEMPKIWSKPLLSLQRDLQDSETDAVDRFYHKGIVGLPMHKLNWRKPLDWIVLADLFAEIDPRLGRIIKEVDPQQD